MISGPTVHVPSVPRTQQNAVEFFCCSVSVHGLLSDSESTVAVNKLMHQATAADASL